MKSSKIVFTFEKQMHIFMTDNEIIRGIRDNSESAWRELFAKTHDQLRPSISPLLQRAVESTYDDIYELACLDLMDNVKDGKLGESENTNLVGYMFKICWRRALRAEIKRKKDDGRLDEFPQKEEAELEFDPVEQADAETNIGSSMEYLSVKPGLSMKLASIPESCRKLFRRFYWDKMPMKDIAAAMGLKNDDVAKATKSKCMKKFREIAKAMLANDEKAEEAVRRTVERDALRDLLEECRNDASGDWSIAALTEDKDDTQS